MTKRTRAELDKIIRRDLPGYRLARQTAPTASDGPMRDPATAIDSRTPSIDALRRKYLGPDSGPIEEAAVPDPPMRRRRRSRPLETTVLEGATDHRGDDETEIVTAEPDSTIDAWDRAKRPKAVVIGADGKVIGAQG